MRIITRYLLKAFLGPLFLCLISFNTIFIIFDLFGHLSKFIDSGLGFWGIVRYYLGVISMFSHWFLPASCMLATLYTMWQLSRHNELTAMRASGISFRSLTVPFFCVATVMSVLTFVNSEYITPEASNWSEQLKNVSFEIDEIQKNQEFPYFDAKSRRTWIFSSANPLTEHTMSNPLGSVEVKRDVAGVNVWGVRASKAAFVDGVWWLSYPEEMVFDIDGQELPKQENSPELPSLLPIPELTETPRAMMLELRQWDFYSLQDMFYYLKIKGIDDPGKWYELFYRLAAPWACVVITLFAIPAGISTGRQSVMRSVIMVLATFFGFYAVTLVLKFMAHHGVFPPLLAAILPNLAFLCVGSVMYRKLT